MNTRRRYGGRPRANCVQIRGDNIQEVTDREELSAVWLAWTRALGKWLRLTWFDHDN